MIAEPRGRCGRDAGPPGWLVPGRGSAAPGRDGYADGVDRGGTVTDVIVGVIAIVAGAILCFRGYLAMRTMISLWARVGYVVYGCHRVIVDGDDLAALVHACGMLYLP